MSLLHTIEPLSLILGVFCGSSTGLLVVRIKDTKLKRIQAEIARKEDDLLIEKIECFHEQERVEEMKGHLQYKTNLLNQKLKSLDDTEKRLLAREAELSDKEEGLAERENQIKARLDKAKKQLKGARARARRLSSKE